MRNFALQTLEHYGYTVLEVKYPCEAMSVCEGHKGIVHLVVTDVVMPGMSGRELAKEITRRYPYVKVLYISGYTDNTIVKHGILEPGINFLQKPFTPSILAQKVREVLDKP